MNSYQLALNKINKNKILIGNERINIKRGLRKFVCGSLIQRVNIVVSLPPPYWGGEPKSVGGGELTTMHKSPRKITNKVLLLLGMLVIIIPVTAFLRLLRSIPGQNRVVKTVLMYFLEIWHENSRNIELLIT